MEKTSELYADGKQNSVTFPYHVASKRRRYGFPATFIAVALLCCFAIAWFMPRPCNFWTRHFSFSLSYEERAQKILRENPLIGSSFLAAIEHELTSPRWPQ